MATGLVKCNKASLCYRKHKRETLKSKRKAIIVGGRNNTPMEHLQYCVTSPSKTIFPKIAMSRLWVLLVRIEQRLGKESLKELKIFSFLNDKIPHIISNQHKLFFILYARRKYFPKESQTDMVILSPSLMSIFSKTISCFKK